MTVRTLAQSDPKCTPFSPKRPRADEKLTIPPDARPRDAGALTRFLRSCRIHRSVFAEPPTVQPPETGPVTPRSPSETARAACLFLLASFDEPLRIAFLERAARHLGPDTSSLGADAVDAALESLFADGLALREGDRGPAGRIRCGVYFHNRRRAPAVDAGRARGWRADAPAVDSLHWELQLGPAGRERVWDMAEAASKSRRRAALLLAFRLGRPERFAVELLRAVPERPGYSAEWRLRQLAEAQLELAAVLDGTGELHDGDPVPDGFRLLLGPATLLRAFAAGRPLGDRLFEYVHALEDGGERPRPSVRLDSFLLAQSLACWCGDVALLDRLAALARRDEFRPDRPAAAVWLRADAAARLLLAGRTVPEDGRKTGASQLRLAAAPWLEDARTAPVAELVRTAFRLPGLLLAMLAESDRFLAPHTGRNALVRAAEEIGRACLGTDLAPLADAAESLCKGQTDAAENRLLASIGPDETLRPPAALLAALLRGQVDPDRRCEDFSGRDAALAGIDEAFRAGLLLPEANIAGALRWIPALADRADAFLADAAARGVRPVLCAETPPPVWQTALDALEKALAPAAYAAEGDARDHRFEWRLFADGVPGRPGFYALQSLVVLWQKRLKDGGWSIGRTYARRDLERHERAVGPVSPADAAVRNALLSLPGWVSLGENGFRPETGENGHSGVLAALAGNPDATLAVREPEAKRRTPFEPVALSVGRLGLRATRGPDGSLFVEPDVRDYSLPRALQGRFLLRKTARGRFELLLPDPVYEAAMLVFARHADGDSLDVPAEGAARAARILASAALAGRLSLAGDLAAETDPAALPRVEGDPTPVARLAWRGSSLELALRVRPAPGRGLLLPPGEGAAERTVLPEDGAAPGSDEARPARLVRDLAEETRRAAPVFAALAPFADARAAGAAFWLFDDDLAALEALDALHALGESAVRLEWRDGSPAPQVAGVARARLEGGEGADRWFSLSGDLEFDDGRVVSFLDLLRKLPERGGRYVRLDEGRYLRLTGTLRKRLDALAAAGTPGKGGTLRFAPAALLALAEVESHAEFAEAAEAPDIALPPALAARVSELRARLAAPVSPPAGLQAVLRPYQLEGYAWLSRLAACGLGACLADDMGLGKTVQLIALLLERAADGPSLVVAPLSVVSNWAAELRRFAPSLEVFDAADPASAKAGAGSVVLASYGLLVSRTDRFESVAWNVLALDEAQAVKNHATQRAKAVRKLRAAVRVAATGTPVENRLSEFWSLFDFLDPGLLGSHEEFARRFVGEGGRASTALKRLASPLVLRRLKGDVLRDLPPKTEVVLRVPLGPAEASAYEACRRKAVETLRNANRPEDRIRILAELTRLRRFCCHPSLVVPDFPAAAKLDAFLELARELRDGGHRALVFSQFTDFLAIVRERLAEEGIDHLYLDGSTPAKERERLVGAFQRGDGGDLFLVSLKAGGTGLNLTAADYVVLLDPWWNPAVEDQAADRAHRIGQTRPVTVYRLVAAGTVEEKVLALHDAKRALAADLLSGAGSAALTPEELLALFR